MNKRITKKSQIEHLGKEERDTIWQELVDDYNNHLKSYGVSLPHRTTNKASWLILLKAFEMTQVQKELFGEFARIENPNASGDQQVRHLKRDGWYILGKNDAIPDTSNVVPSGDYLLVTTKQKHPDFEDSTAGDTFTDDQFDVVKSDYKMRCASCGSEEGQPHLHQTTKIVKLQKGHMDPNKPMAVGNVIPQCQVCNQSYRDKFIFDETGKVRKINSVDLVIAADIQLQRKIFDILKEKFDKDES